MIKITKAGWIYISLTVLLGVAGVNTGNNLVYLIEAAMLSFLLISGFIGKKNLDNLDIQIDFPEEIFAKVDFPVKMRIKNRKKIFPSFLITVHFDEKKLTVPYVGAGEEYELTFNHRYSRRGFLEIRDLNVCSVYPFNFFVRCIVYMKKIPVIVYPYPKRCEIFQDYSEKKGETERSSNNYGLQGELISVREYIRGDSLKRIHWKASAKTGELKTKEFADTAGKPIVLDMNRMEGNKEERISCATYTILELYRKGVPFGLIYGENFIKPEYSRKQKITILKILAQM